MIAFLGLGSNLGDRRSHLARAVEGLRRLDPGLELSPLYETEPVGGPAQDPYLNLVVRLETKLSPKELLEAAQALEGEARRVRTEKNGPRTLDIDVLLVDDLVIAAPELTVPHPRMGDRAFVLAPLEDLDPSKVPPRWRERLGAAEVDRQVRRVANLVTS
ncbi:MAG: 2-amino-4-hydroxy-6-hydroxymethyldihydropteridine diphosphokinase [Acidimicrobiales bacterium]